MLLTMCAQESKTLYSRRLYALGKEWVKEWARGRRGVGLLPPSVYVYISHVKRYKMKKEELLRDLFLEIFSLTCLRKHKRGVGIRKKGGGKKKTLYLSLLTRLLFS